MCVPFRDIVAEHEDMIPRRGSAKTVTKLSIDHPITSSNSIQKKSSKSKPKILILAS